MFLFMVWNINDCKKYSKEDKKELERLIRIREAKPELLEKLLNYGVFWIDKQDSQHRLDKIADTYDISGSYYRNSWVYPVYNALGEVVYIVTYSVDRPRNEKYVKLVPKGQEEFQLMGMENLHRIFELSMVIIVEGTMDFLQLSNRNYPLVASQGTYITEPMKRLLNLVDFVVVIVDEDPQGDGFREQVDKFMLYNSKGKKYNEPNHIHLPYNDIDDCANLDEDTFNDLVAELDFIVDAVSQMRSNKTYVTKQDLMASKLTE